MSGNGGRQYAQIMKRIWTDEHWKQLSPNAQWLYTLLISQDSINYAGVLPLTVRRWTRLATGVTTEVVHGALEELRSGTPSRFVIVDWDEEEVLVRTFIRNDELWKQPRMLAMACSQALTTRSGVLRAELGEELVKLSTLVKSVASVQETASLLVAGREPPPEPPPGAPHTPPHREGMTPSNGKDYSVDLAPSTVKEGTDLASLENVSSPEHETDFEEPLRRRIPIDGWRLVRDLIPAEHPQAVRTGLAVQVATLLGGGTPEADARQALQLWLSKPALGPGILPSLVSEVIRKRNPGMSRATSDNKVAYLIGVANADSAQQREIGQ